MKICKTCQHSIYNPLRDKLHCSKNRSTCEGGVIGEYYACNLWKKEKDKE